MHLSNSTKGYCFGLIAGMSFGLIPLFSIPVIADGMDNVSILIYRFLFGCIGMLSALLVQKSPLKITLGEFFRISLLSLFYIGTAITTLNAYDYLSSGIATALVYTDPIWCALIGLLFLREKLSWKTTSALVITIAGVLLLTNALTEPAKFSAIGVSWGLLSGLTYALYIIFLPRLNLKGIPSLNLTFYGEEGAKHLKEVRRLIGEYNKTEKQCPLRLPDVLLVITGGAQAYTRPDGVIVCPLSALRP